MKLITAATNLSAIMEFQLFEGESIKKNQIYLLTSPGQKVSDPITVTEVIGRRGDLVALRVERSPEPLHHSVGAIAKLQDL